VIGLAAVAGGEEPSRAGEVMPPGLSITPPQMPSEARIHTGKVLSKIDAGRYTYIEIDTDDGTIWAAVPLQQVSVGDTARIYGDMPMREFYSPSLDRRFELIYFAAAATITSSKASNEVEDAVKSGESKQAVTSAALKPAAAASPTCPSEMMDPAQVDFSGIERAEGGKTIAELFENKSGLAGQQVTLRGRVVKCLSGILGRNWLRLRDGTAGPGDANVLTITSEEAAGIGSTLVVRGTVAVDKDFGHGYAYDLLLEDASITVE
jgi:hypothetical protein